MIKLIIVASFFIAVVLYFLPSIIASHTNHRNFMQIFLVNVLLGWSVVGWIVSFLWACSNDKD